jgi:predicted nucleic-acid-binding protein
MKALDTNVLVRFLVKDDEKQAAKIYSIFKQAESDNIVFWISSLVVLETIWVLESVYNEEQDEILNAIGEILLMPIFKFESQAAIRQFIFYARIYKLDLSDALIGCSARQSGCDKVLTFDKKASKLDLFELIDPNSAPDQ